MGQGLCTTVYLGLDSHSALTRRGIGHQTLTHTLLLLVGHPGLPAHCVPAHCETSCPLLPTVYLLDVRRLGFSAQCVK